MRLSLLGISISLLGIALILTSTAASFGLGLSFLGFLVSLVSCFVHEVKKVRDFRK